MQKPLWGSSCCVTKQCWQTQATVCVPVTCWRVVCAVHQKTCSLDETLKILHSEKVLLLSKQYSQLAQLPFATVQFLT